MLDSFFSLKALVSLYRWDPVGVKGRDQFQNLCGALEYSSRLDVSGKHSPRRDLCHSEGCLEESCGI